MSLELVSQRLRRERIQAAVQQIFDNISGRAGLDMSTLDEAVQHEIKADIYEILDHSGCGRAVLLVRRVRWP